MRHIIWDWNGTLFDDFELVLRASNAAMTSVGGRELDADEYHQRFKRPVHAFYSEVLGRDFTQEQWKGIDDAFHDTYHELMHEADLRSGAREALSELSDTGVTQSVLSMWRHENLVPFVRHLNIDQHFLCLDGLRELGGGHKEPHLRQHLETLCDHDVKAANVTMIGDTEDDAHAAQALGIHVVLIAGGEHSAETLDKTGAPVAESLHEAIELAYH